MFAAITLIPTFCCMFAKITLIPTFFCIFVNTTNIPTFCRVFAKITRILQILIRTHVGPFHSSFAGRQFEVAMLRTRKGYSRKGSEYATKSGNKHDFSEYATNCGNTRSPIGGHL